MTLSGIDAGYPERVRALLIKTIDENDSRLAYFYGEKKYSSVAGCVAEHAENMIKMSMISYRVDQDIAEAKRYVQMAENAIALMTDLQFKIENLDRESIGIAPNHINIWLLEPLIFIAMLNKSPTLLEQVYQISQSKTV